MTEVRRVWRGAQALAFADTTRELDIEGAFRSGKTTLCLWRELHYALEYPGIHTLLCRWSDDATQKILRPKWREICEEAGVKVEWNAQESYDELPNGSRVYVTGLKCVAPDTLILTEDLRWVRADSLVVGSRLLGVPEHVPSGRAHARQLIPSVVTAVDLKLRPSVRVYTDQGQTVVSADHPFLRVSVYRSKNGGYSQPKMQWTEASALRPGQGIKFVGQPWQEDRTWEAGWLAGITDGEGSLCRQQGQGIDVSIAQSEGPLIEPITAALAGFGFKFRTASIRFANKQRYSWYLCGSGPVLQFLGRIRPRRLLEKFVEAVRSGGAPMPINNAMMRGTAIVEAVEPIGLAPTVGMSTSTRTFIGDGFVGHNTQDLYSRYAKFRGLTLARVYCDQTEEIPHDVYLELSARLSQQGMPLQITISPNAVDESHWIARRFPDNNREPGRKYLPISIYTNASNLGQAVIDGILQTYPPDHPKHRMTILGLRGFNVIGEPVYAGAFDRKLHVKPLQFEPNIPLDEGIDFGKHHPCVVWRQTTALGNIHYLGGIMGRDLFLEDFLPLVLQYRRLWFPNPTEIRTACDPAGATANSQGVSSNGVGVLRAHGFTPKWQDSANSPAVRLAMVERLAGYMRKRTPRGEMFAVNDSQWMEVSAEYAKPEDFFAKGLEGGYVWDAHTVSVNNKPMRRPKKDGEFEHGQNASEYLELAFGSQPWKPKMPSLGGRPVTRPATWMGA